MSRIRSWRRSGNVSRIRSWSRSGNVSRIMSRGRHMSTRVE